jgi:hypothetical protein
LKRSLTCCCDDRQDRRPASGTVDRAVTVQKAGSSRWTAALLPTFDSRHGGGQRGTARRAAARTGRRRGPGWSSRCLVRPLADDAELASGRERPEPVVPVDRPATALLPRRAGPVVGLPQPVVRVVRAVVVLVRLLGPRVDAGDTAAVRELEPPLESAGCHAASMPWSYGPSNTSAFRSRRPTGPRTRTARLMLTPVGNARRPVIATTVLSDRPRTSSTGTTRAGHRRAVPSTPAAGTPEARRRGPAAAGRSPCGLQ